jgi:uncharacterized protein
MRKFLIALAVTSLIASPALADVKAGVEAWTKGDFPTAIAEWRPLAIKGDADAQFNLGQAYKLGRGVPADLKQAEDWYRLAALQGHIQAADNYGLVMFQNGNRQQAMQWIEKSADRGEPRAQYILGTALFNGDLVTKDWVRAYALMTRSSASGLAPASTSLAQMDRFIPTDQRQKGLAMARELELGASRTAAASQAPQSGQRPLPPRVLPAAPVRPVDLPPSQGPGAGYPAPVNQYPPTQYPPVAQGPTPVYNPPVYAPPPPVYRPPVYTPPAPRPPAPRVVQQPDPVEARPTYQSARPSAAPSAGRRGWRVQLGAFSQDARARALYDDMLSRVPELSNYQPFLVKAGSITRLQLGPVASEAAADRLCGSVRARGGTCVSVAP